MLATFRGGLEIILARQTGGTTVQLSPKQVNIPALWRANRIIERYL
jgi:hypothetical protein